MSVCSPQGKHLLSGLSVSVSGLCLCLSVSPSHLFLCLLVIWIDGYTDKMRRSTKSHDTPSSELLLLLSSSLLSRMVRM